jgi:hypothetical protein
MGWIENELVWFSGRNFGAAIECGAVAAYRLTDKKCNRNQHFAKGLRSGPYKKGQYSAVLRKIGL